MKGFFVTGTDTGVGKTFATVSLIHYYRAKGLKVFAFKPVETGCERQRDLGPDQEAITKAAGAWQTGCLAGIYQLRCPIAPLVAAQAESRILDLNLVMQTIKDGAGQAAVTIVEGAGGWRVPLTESEDIAELARRIGLPIVLVGRAGLGTINHTLLSIEAIERDGCVLASVVLSRRPDESLEFSRSNAKQIQRRWAGPVVILDTDPNVFSVLQ